MKNAIFIELVMNSLGLEYGHGNQKTCGDRLIIIYKYWREEKNRVLSLSCDKYHVVQILYLHKFSAFICVSCSMALFIIVIW